MPRLVQALCWLCMCMHSVYMVWLTVLYHGSLDQILPVPLKPLTNLFHYTKNVANYLDRSSYYQNNILLHGPLHLYIIAFLHIFQYETVDFMHECSLNDHVMGHHCTCHLTSTFAHMSSHSFFYASNSYVNVVVHLRTWLALKWSILSCTPPAVRMCHKGCTSTLYHAPRCILPPKLSICPIRDQLWH